MSIGLQNFLVLQTGLLFVSIVIGTSAKAIPLQSESVPVSTEQSSHLEPQPSAPSISLLETDRPVMEQVTDVSQLSDVNPTDWAFQALQSLVERYGCIAGYPDQTYRGNQPLTRYEFAAGLNACRDRINELLAAATSDRVKKEDLATLQTLQEQFSAELATLRERAETLEIRTTRLQNQQFSTTTKLRGVAIFLAGDTFGRRANNTPAKDSPDTTSTFLEYFFLLQLNTSFKGRDQLTARFVASNIPVLAFTTGTSMANLVADPTPTFNGLSIDRLNYRFPIGKKATIWLGAVGLQPYEFFPILNPFVASIDGSASRFSWFNPSVYRTGFAGTGVGVAYQFNPRWQLHASYIADTAQANNPAWGLFSGSNGVISQLTFTPTPQFGVGLVFAHKYFVPGRVLLQGTVGSLFSITPFEQNATSSDNLGLQFNWRVNPRLSLGGWLGYAHADQLSGGNSDATIVNGAFNIAFPDLFKRGNVGGFVVGVPPKVIRNNYQSRGIRREDEDTSLHLEAFYTYRLSSHVSITPNVYVILNPEHNKNNDTIWVGLLRTNFTF